MFLPVCKDSSNNLIISPGASSTAHFPPALDLSSGIKHVPDCNAALDLSKKCNSSNSLLSVKKEPNNSRDTEIKLQKGKKTNGVSETTDVDTKSFEPLSMETTLPILITDVRSEAPGAEVDAPESFQQVQRELKMEVEHRRLT